MNVYVYSPVICSNWHYGVLYQILRCGIYRASLGGHSIQYDENVGTGIIVLTDSQKSSPGLSTPHNDYKALSIECRQHKIGMFYL